MILVTHTSHSLWPWKLSGLRFLMATTIPVPGLVGPYVFSSIHPLKTRPNPPSPIKFSCRKFLVASLRSFKLKDFRLLEKDLGTFNSEVIGADSCSEEFEYCFGLLACFLPPEIRRKASSMPLLRLTF